MRLNGLMLTALIALGVTVAYDKYGRGMSFRKGS